jgi:hypothetical protein
VKFDPDVIEGVKARAMNGVKFEDDEVIAALEEVAGSLTLYGDGIVGTLVQRAAGRELRSRNPLPPSAPTFWERVAMAANAVAREKREQEATKS